LFLALQNNITFCVFWFVLYSLDHLCFLSCSLSPPTTSFPYSLLGPILFSPVFSTESEQKKILTQAVDAKKEREFAEEFNMMRDQLEEASVHNLQLKNSVYMNTCYFEGSLSLFGKNSMSVYWAD